MARLTSLLHAEINGEGQRPTPLELFFDVVFVFAFTQVTAWIADEPTWRTVLEGMVILAVLWWTWVAWVWIGNVLTADRGAPMLGFIVAMPAVFAMGLSVGYVWIADAGALAPMALALGYLFMRVVHLVVYGLGARKEELLMRRVLWTSAAWLPAAVLIMVGALLPADQRLWWWGGTMVVDFAATWVLAVTIGGWEVRSSKHLSGRYAQAVTIALGLSVVAVGAVARDRILTDGLLITGMLAVLLAVAMWWPYFRGLRPAMELTVKKAARGRRSDMARDMYAYQHFPLIAGVVLTAAGVERAFLQLNLDDPGGTASIILVMGGALYAGASALMIRTAGGKWTWLAVAAVFLATSALWVGATPAVVTMIIIAVALVVAGILTPAVALKKPKAVEGRRG